MAKKLFHRVYDEHHRGVVNLIVTEGDNLLDTYSDIDGTDIDEPVASYIVAHSQVYRPSDEIRLNIVSSHLPSDSGGFYREAIMRYFKRQWLTVRQSIVMHYLVAMVLFLVGALGFYLLAVVGNSNFPPLAYTFVEIFVWVFFWESVHVLFISTATLYSTAVRYKHLARLTVTMITK